MLAAFCEGREDTAWVIVGNTRLYVRRNVRSFQGQLYRTLDIGRVEHDGWPDGRLPRLEALQILAEADSQLHLDVVFLDRFIAHHFADVAVECGYKELIHRHDYRAYYKVLRDEPYRLRRHPRKPRRHRSWKHEADKG